ncbi:DUF1800 family protein [Horticoccus sp. 23ND18S-11]|uniref:DUF1800 family protein n=1 Tax=Horticoccus sp. 23ND18S-11 TaxID=3391832 RepID=UPI0039C8F3BD
MKTILRLVPAALVLASASLPTAPAFAAQYDQRLANLSTRAQVGTGSNIMITGFVVQEGAPKRVLIRAIGARLAQAPFNVSGALTNPQLQLFNSNNVLVLANDNWSAADAATMTSVGAFALTNNSADAALVATLSPGAYTAQVSGVNNTTGVAILEIYDVTGSARLMNLSTRALVGNGSNTLFSGLSVAPGGGARRVLVRAAGPGLTALGVDGALTDPSIAILDSAGRQVASGANNDWETGGTAALTAAFAQAGAFPFRAGSRDAAILLDLPAGNYTIQVNGVGGATGTALVEVYDLSPENLSTVSVAATVPSTDSTALTPVVFTFSRVGLINSPVTVSYTVDGTATAGTDFQALPGQVTIPAGASSATVSLVPKANPANTNNRTATLTITPNLSYGVGTNDRAGVTIFANSGSLYVSTLRALPNATTSTAYGTATVQLAPDETTAFVNVSFANLSSPEVVGHLAIDGDYVFNLPQGQVAGAFWDFSPVGRYSRADLIAALKAGRVTVSIDTAVYPAGELGGGFVKSSGTAVFNPPAAPPALDLTRITSTDAARFLTQATFGPTAPEIETLMARGYRAWIAEQMALPASSQRAATMADFAAVNAGGQGTQVNGLFPLPGGSHRQAAWWKTAVTGQDQLRQRVAFALSQILVASDANGTINAWQEGAANYYDIFVDGAFGNFREVLEKVTLSPIMGIYLSSLRNAKAAGGTTPDENYAREIMQLFSIGLHELNPDGTLRLDPNGQPIPTYTQETIVQTAKVFTGWGYANAAAGATANANLFRGSPANYISPMMLWPAFHDDTAKTIVGGRVLPAGQDGVKDLQDTLDALFNHPSTGPFITRQLIQRLVTSNPSPGYIYRVAQVFANNGAGVRGDLGAVVRAILLDYEARSGAVAATATFGKLKEPLLRATAMFRAFGAASNLGRFNIANPEGALAQAALRAPTVFNFYEPNFVLPGAVASAGLYAPEYQILNDTTALTQPNFYYTYIYNNRSTTDPNQQTIGLNLTSWLSLARTPDQLVDWLNLLLASGAMPKSAADRIAAAVAAMPAGTATNTANDLERVRSAIYLTLTSQYGAVQK